MKQVILKKDKILQNEYVIINDLKDLSNFKDYQAGSIYLGLPGIKPTQVTSGLSHKLVQLRSLVH